MTSPVHIAPNCADARLSTGPRIVLSKDRSSRNRLTRGLCGPHTVLPGEDAAEHEHLLNALLDEHKPAGPTETLLVAQLAQTQWKLNRIAATEAELFARQILPGEPNRNLDGDIAPPVTSGEAQLQFEPNLAAAFEKAAANLAALARHEAAARRAFDKALGNLWKLQGPRRHKDVERAAQAELESFIDAYVNAPMPETLRRPEQPCDAKQTHDDDGAAVNSANSNPIRDTEAPSWLEPPTMRSYIERHIESDPPPRRNAEAGVSEA